MVYSRIRFRLTEFAEVKTLVISGREQQQVKSMDCYIQFLH